MSEVTLTSSVVESTHSVTASPLDTSTMTLLDIELPVSPQFDWLGVVSGVSIVLLVLVALAALIYVLRYSKQASSMTVIAPLALRWQLWKLKRHLPAESAGHLRPTYAQTFAVFYEWCQNFKMVSCKIHSAQNMALLEKIDQLTKQSEYMAFSNHTVSRETYCKTLNEAQILLTKSLNAKTYWRGFAQCIQRVEKN